MNPRSSHIMIVALVAIPFGSNCLDETHCLGQSLSVERIASVTISGDATDKSGLMGTLETGHAANRLGGFSAIDAESKPNRYLVLSDRGPGDGAATYLCRYHEFELTIDAEKKRIEPRLLTTIMLHDVGGVALDGSLASLHKHAPATGNAFDPEGVRVVEQQSLAISDEYGPSISIFNRTGTRLKMFPLPKSLRLCDNPNATDCVGAFSNRGLEGLTISADGKSIVAAFQGPLIQDGRIENGKCLGTNTRWLWCDRASGTIRQLVYPLTDESTGVSELLAVDQHRYLVLERDSLAGSEARFKHIYLADTRDATDVSQFVSLNKDAIGRDVRPITKSLVIDLCDPKFGLSGPTMPEKPEGICWGGGLADGRRVLMLCVDNDFETERPSEFHAFALTLN